MCQNDVVCYIVGGFVRDTLLGRRTANIDLVIAADALKAAPALANALKGSSFPLDEENGMARVVIDDTEAAGDAGQWEIDLATLQDSLEEDLARRDFTINAMAVDIKAVKSTIAPEAVIDPLGGLADLKKQSIRIVSPSALPQDPLRLMRAVRLAAELGFTLTPQTKAQVREHYRLISTVASERVREELLRILAAPEEAGGAAYLDSLGLLTTVIPELEQSRGITQPKEHHWDVLKHSLKVVAAVDFLLQRGRWGHGPDEEILATVPWSDTLTEHFQSKVSPGSTRRVLTKLAALLHDIAKPQTKALDHTGRMRFLGHDMEGAVTAAAVLERLRFSTKEIKAVETMVRYHMRPTQMSHEALPTRRAIYRYFRDTGESGVDTLFLNLADHLATRGPTLDLAHWREHTNMVDYVLTRRFAEESVIAPTKLISGHDLIKAFGLKPGPELGRILEAVREAQADGSVTNKGQALSYAEQMLARQGRT